ncbi:MAG: hypothetical protein KDD85_11145 [Parvularculaceae bacterium]|nr:hypothetical protein [Parvularculaceae bacterium]
MNKFGGRIAYWSGFLAIVAGCQTTEGLTRDQVLTSAEQAIENEDGRGATDSDQRYDPNEIICKTQQRSGSRLNVEKECRTAEEWRNIKSSTKRDLDRVRSRITNQ